MQPVYKLTHGVFEVYAASVIDEVVNVLERIKEEYKEKNIVIIRESSLFFSFVQLDEKDPKDDILHIFAISKKE